MLSLIVYIIPHLAATGISGLGEPATSWSDEVSADSIGSRQSKAVRGIGHYAVTVWGKATTGCVQILKAVPVSYTHLRSPRD